MRYRRHRRAHPAVLGGALLVGAVNALVDGHEWAGAAVLAVFSLVLLAFGLVKLYAETAGPRRVVRQPYPVWHPPQVRYVPLTPEDMEWLRRQHGLGM